MSTKTLTPTSLQMHANYMSEAFAPNLDGMIEKFLKTVTDENVDFDTIVGIGLSGALVVPTIARALGLKWAIVRKQDGSHSTNMIEGEIGQRWLFVDDFVALGGTLRYVKQTVADTFKDVNELDRMYSYDYRPGQPPKYQTEFVGTYQYHWNNIIRP